MKDELVTWKTPEAFEDYFITWALPDLDKYEREDPLDRIDPKEFYRSTIKYFIETGQLPKEASKWSLPTWV